MAGEFHRIQEPSQLEGLRVRRLWSWRAPARVAIDAAAAPIERAREWERSLSRLQGACGCEQGGVGLILGLAGYLLFLLLRPGGWGDPGSAELWAGAATLALSSTAGKVIGLRLAQRELQRTAREIRAQWATEGRGSSPQRAFTHPAGGPTLRKPGCCGGPPPRPARQLGTKGEGT